MQVKCKDTPAKAKHDGCVILWYKIPTLLSHLQKTAPPTITRQSTITNMVTADIAVHDDDRGGIVVNVFNDYGDA